MNVFNEIIELKEEYIDTTNTSEFNQKALNIMIDNNIITKENAKKLIDSGKIKDIKLD